MTIGCLGREIGCRGIIGVVSVGGVVTGCETGEISGSDVGVVGGSVTWLTVWSFVVVGLDIGIGVWLGESILIGIGLSKGVCRGRTWDGESVSVV